MIAMLLVVGRERQLERKGRSIMAATNRSRKHGFDDHTRRVQ